MTMKKSNYQYTLFLEHVIIPRFKTDARLKKGEPEQTIAGYMQLGWTTMFPERESDSNSMLLTKNPVFDHEKLCRFDLLYVKYQPTEDQQFVYKEFQDQLFHHSEGYYETELLWEVRHPRLGQETEERTIISRNY